MCLKRTHFQCAESGAMDDNVLRAVGLKTSNLAFFCKKYSSSPIKGKLTILDGDGISTETKSFNYRMRNKDEQVQNMTKEIERLKQRNVQLNTQLVKVGEKENHQPNITEGNIVRVLQSQIDSLTDQNKLLNMELVSKENELASKDKADTEAIDEALLEKKK